jgi:hypothetical protein
MTLKAQQTQNAAEDHYEKHSRSQSFQRRSGLLRLQRSLLA